MLERGIGTVSIRHPNSFKNPDSGRCFNGMNHRERASFSVGECMDENSGTIIVFLDNEQCALGDM
jgi:hypothetical protein